MHKNIGAALIREDEAKSAICVEEFDPSSWHAINPVQSTLRAPTRRRDVPGHGTTRCSKPGRPLSAPSCHTNSIPKPHRPLRPNSLTPPTGLPGHVDGLAPQVPRCPNREPRLDVV